MAAAIHGGWRKEMKKYFILIQLVLINTSLFCENGFYLDNDYLSISIESRAELGCVDKESIKYFCVDIEKIELQLKEDNYCVFIASLTNNGIRKINELMEKSGISSFEFNYRNKVIGYGLLQKPIVKNEVIWIMGDEARYSEIERIIKEIE
jgi:hypothetical protein